MSGNEKPDTTKTRQKKRKRKATTNHAKNETTLQIIAITLLVISLIILIREVKSSGAVSSVAGFIGNVAGGIGNKVSNITGGIGDWAVDSAITFLCRDPIHAMRFVREIVNSIPISHDAKLWRDTDVSRLRDLHAMKHDIAFQDAANPETAIILSNVVYNLHMVIQNPPLDISNDPRMIPILENYKIHFLERLSKAYIK